MGQIIAPFLKFFTFFLYWKDIVSWFLLSQRRSLSADVKLNMGRKASWDGRWIDGKEGLLGCLQCSLNVGPPVRPFLFLVANCYTVAEVILCPSHLQTRRKSDDHIMSNSGCKSNSGSGSWTALLAVVCWRFPVAVPEWHYWPLIAEWYSGCWSWMARLAIIYSRRRSIWQVVMHAVEEGVRQDCPQRILFNDGASYEAMSWSDLRPLVMMTTQVYFRRTTQVYFRRNKTTTVGASTRKKIWFP